MKRDKAGPEVGVLVDSAEHDANDVDKRGEAKVAAAAPAPSSAQTTANDSGAEQAATGTQEAHNLMAAVSLAQRGDELGAALVPLRLASIRIEGAPHLRPSFLSRLCRPYVDASLSTASVNRLIYGHRIDQTKPGQSTSLPSLLSLLASVGNDVGALDALGEVAASLEPSRIQSSPLLGQSMTSLQEDVDVVLRCKEKSRFFAKSSTEVGNGEGTAAIQATMRNVFGGSETADVSATIGTRTRRAFYAAFTTPVFALPDHTFTVSAFAQDRDLTSYASATEGVRGARLAFRCNANGDSLLSGVHELAYDLSHRHLARLQPLASLSMRQLAGHSVKSSLTHTLTRDWRDSNGLDPSTSALPAQGSLFKSVLEYAGLGGDANFAKAEVEGQQLRCFGVQDEFGTSLSVRLGILRSFSGRAPAFSDRFQLGGPTSVRMFRYNSLGPKDGLDSLGGEAYAAVGSSVFAPFWPGKEHWPVKWHAFVNAGQLVQLDHHRTGLLSTSWLRQNGALVWNDLLSKPSSSAGVGIVLRQGGLRAEVNVGVPLTIRKGDGTRKGIQLGIGIDFL